MTWQLFGESVLYAFAWAGVRNVAMHEDSRWRDVVAFVPIYMGLRWWMQ